MTTGDGRTVNVALIGYGLGGANFHAPFIDSTPRMRLSAIMTTDPSRVALARSRYPGARIVSTFDELAATKPDVVAVSTPNRTHAPLARQALEAGAHVVVDKPFAATGAEAREIGTLAAHVGRIAFPFQNRRWDGDYLTLKSLIADGSLGRVFRFESRFDRWRPVRKPGWTHPEARERLENIVHDLGTHLIDQALELFGPVTRVYAELGKVDASIVTSDEMFISLTHESGVHSHLSSSMSAGVAAPRYHVYGTGGSYVKHGVDPQEMMLRGGMAPGDEGFGAEPETDWGTFGDGESQRRVRTLDANYAPFYAGVAAAILDGAPPPVSLESVVRQLDVADAAFESAESGEVVTLSS